MKYHWNNYLYRSEKKKRKKCVATLKLFKERKFLQLGLGFDLMITNSIPKKIPQKVAKSAPPLLIIHCALMHSYLIRRVLKTRCKNSRKGLGIQNLFVLIGIT